MAFSRGYHTLTSLPDGQVLVTGGETASDGRDITKSALAAELWDPATEAWTTMAAQLNGRLYHSTALLLPAGRVLVAVPRTEESRFRSMCEARGLPATRIGVVDPGSDAIEVQGHFTVSLAELRTISEGVLPGLFG